MFKHILKKNFIKQKLVLLFVIIIASAGAVLAQESCSCSAGNNGCTASRTCSAGWRAECTCSATGCSSQCVKLGEEENYRFFDNNSIVKSLRNTDAKNIGSVLSNTFSENISFEPTGKSFVFDFPKKDSISHWEILEFLASKGNLKIHGYPLEFWQEMRESLLKGGELNICVGEASVANILKHVSFITGKKFTIVNGDEQAKIRGSVQGSNLDEFLQNLNKLGKVIIVRD